MGLVRDELPDDQVFRETRLVRIPRRSTLTCVRGYGLAFERQKPMEVFDRGAVFSHEMEDAAGAHVLLLLCGD